MVGFRATSTRQRKRGWSEINPFKLLYWRQFGGGPSEELLRKMDPERHGK